MFRYEHEPLNLQRMERVGQASLNGLLPRACRPLRHPGTSCVGLVFHSIAEPCKYTPLGADTFCAVDGARLRFCAVGMIRRSD